MKESSVDLGRRSLENGALSKVRPVIPQGKAAKQSKSTECH